MNIPTYMSAAIDKFLPLIKENFEDRNLEEYEKENFLRDYLRGMGAGLGADNEDACLRYIGERMFTADYLESQPWFYKD